MNKNKIKKTLKENNEILKKYNVDSIALFGSVVRNELRKNSDIDFLVKFKYPSYDNYVGLLSELEKIFTKKIDLVNINALNERIKPYILKEAEWVN